MEKLVEKENVMGAVCRGPRVLPREPEYTLIVRFCRAIKVSTDKGMNFYLKERGLLITSRMFRNRGVLGSRLFRNLP